MGYITIKDAGNNDVKIAITPDLGGNVFAQVFAPYQTNRTDNYTGAASGTAVDVSSAPCSRFALQVKGAGGAAGAWSVVLEGSLDGVTYTTILTHASADADADGATKLLATSAPVKYFRSRCISLTLGGATNIAATILGQVE